MLSLPGLRLMEKTTAWTREGENVGKYKIVMVKMGKVKLELFGRADQPNLSEQQKEIIEV